MVGVQKAETAGNCGNCSVSVAEQIGGNTDFHLIDVMLRGKSGFPQEESPQVSRRDMAHIGKFRNTPPPFRVIGNHFDQIFKQYRAPGFFAESETR